MVDGVAYLSSFLLNTRKIGIWTGLIVSMHTSLIDSVANFQVVEAATYWIVVLISMTREPTYTLLYRGHILPTVEDTSVFLFCYIDMRLWMESTCLLVHWNHSSTSENSVCDIVCQWQ